MQWKEKCKKKLFCNFTWKNMVQLSKLIILCSPTSHPKTLWMGMCHIPLQIRWTWGWAVRLLPGQTQQNVPTPPLNEDNSQAESINLPRMDFDTNLPAAFWSGASLPIRCSALLCRRVLFCKRGNWDTQNRTSLPRMTSLWENKASLHHFLN